MTVTFGVTVRFYALPWPWALTLPVAARVLRLRHLRFRRALLARSRRANGRVVSKHHAETSSHDAASNCSFAHRNLLFCTKVKYRAVSRRPLCGRPEKGQRNGTGGHHERCPEFRERESHRARPPAAQTPAAGSHSNFQKITCLTAYDYPTARLVDEAGVDVILVGDSLGMVVLGQESTLSVTIEEMLHHTRAVRRGRAACARRGGHALRELSLRFGASR